MRFMLNEYDNITKLIEEKIKKKDKNLEISMWKNPSEEIVMKIYISGYDFNSKKILETNIIHCYTKIAMKSFVHQKNIDWYIEFSYIGNTKEEIEFTVT